MGHSSQSPLTYQMHLLDSLQQWCQICSFSSFHSLAAVWLGALPPHVPHPSKLSGMERKKQLIKFRITVTMETVIYLIHYPITAFHFTASSNSDPHHHHQRYTYITRILNLFLCKHNHIKFECLSETCHLTHESAASHINPKPVCFKNKLYHVSVYIHNINFHTHIVTPANS